MNICIIKLGAKGDVIRSLPLVVGIRKKFPNAHITWITKKYSEEIGRKIEAYMVVLPADEIDPVTGEPSEKLQKDFAGKIKDVRIT